MKKLSLLMLITAFVFIGNTYAQRLCDECVPADVNLSPIGTTEWGYNIAGDCGNEGKWVGSFDAIENNTYWFDLCEIGSSAIDLDIKICDAACNILAGVDGSSACNWNPSEFSWTCPAGGAGTYYVILAPYSSSASHTCYGTDADTFDMYYYMEEGELPPANDFCAGAEAVGEVTDYPFNTSNATTSGTGTHSIGADIWYVYTATGDGTIDVDVCGSTFDTKLAVWDACGGTELAYEDDDCGLQSAVYDVPVEDGEAYFVQVGGYGSGKGEGDLTIVFTETPASGILDGFVTDFITGLPIEGATIEATPVPFKETGYSDALGYYEIEILNSDLYDVAVSKAGYVPQMVTEVPVTLGMTTTVDFELEPLPPYDLPFTESWDEASFGFQNWSFEPTQGDWIMETASGLYGNPIPAARFTWTPRIFDYSHLLQSYLLDGVAKADEVFVFFDLYLNNFDNAALEQLDFVVFDGTDWQVVDHWDNLGGSFAWTTFSYDISDYAAGNIFRIGWLAYGEDSYSINGWAVDNITVTTVNPVGDLAGTVSNLNSGDPVEGALVSISSASKDPVEVFTDEFGDYLVEGLDFGFYDVSVTKDDYYPTLLEDVEVVSGITSTVDIDLEPVAPVFLTAQYNDEQVSLEWIPLPEEPMDNIGGSEIVLYNDKYLAGETIDLDLSIFYNSEDFEFICGISMDFPDGITVNSSIDIEGPMGSGSILPFNGETGDGVLATWGTPSTNCGFGTFYTDADFVVNITISETFAGSIIIPYEIYGEGLGAPVHQVSGTVMIESYLFNLYRDGEFLTLVDGVTYLDLELTNGQEYCYYVKQLIPGEKAESQQSNIMCATPNLPPVIEVNPLSFYEVMNPDMIVTRTMTITNTTDGPLDLEFFIGEEPDGGEKTGIVHSYQQYLPLDNVNGLDEPIHSQITQPASSVTKSDLLWDNTGITIGNSIISMQYNGYPVDQQLVNVADDFIVPPGVSWTIEEFYSTGNLSTVTPPSGPMIGFMVIIYDDNAGEPGTEIFSEMNFSVTDPSVQNIVLTSPPTLAQGKYWVSVAGISDNDISLDRWNWHTGNPQFESEPALNNRTPINFGLPTFTWFPFSSIGLTYGSMNFALYGTAASTGEFVSVSPSSGIIPAPDEGGPYSMEIEVTFDSEGFGPGYYEDQLIILSNDLNNPEVIVPVAMEIFQPFLEVEAGLYSNELTITPIPDEPDGTDDISACYVECQSTYAPGTTIDLDFYLYFYSPDAEWIDGVGITFPVGVTVNSATDCGGALYNGETGDGIQVTWGDILGGSYWGPVASDQYFSVNVTIDPEFTGDILMDWMIAGDFFGSAPNFAYGQTFASLYIPFVTSYNIYRDGELLEADWPETTYVDAPLPSPGAKQEFCYTVTQNYEFIPPSAHSNVACAEPYAPGDRCDIAFEYAIVDDPSVFGSTTYTGDFVWYSVENPETQDFFVSLCGSDYDSKVAVYESCGDWDGEFPEAFDMHGAIAYNDDSYTCGGGQYSLQSLTHVNWAAPGTYYVLIWGWGGDYGDYELEVYSEQSQLTRVGWGGLSSYVDLNPGKGASMEEIFSDVDEQLVILLNEEGIYWPGQSINTIGDFDTYTGHKAKWSDETTWIVEGDIVFDRSVTFPAGTHWLPVLNITPVEVQGFVTEVAVDFMFDIDNGLIYWPDGGIIPGVEGSLEYLFPGSAYLFRCQDEVTFDFTPFAPVDYSVTIPDNYFKTFENNTTWNNVLKTGDHHIVGFSQSALAQLQAGDYIGVFNAEGICTGMQLYAGKESALAMPVNGNDITTKEVDGMINQEFLNFRVYRDGQVYDVNAIYNSAMPNYDGLFNVNGLSQVIDFKFGPLSIEEDPMSAVMIYPNPSTGIFNIDLQGFENTVKMEVLNSRGQLIYKNELNASHQLDLTAQPQGVYFIRLINSTSVYLEKVVIK